MKNIDVISIILTVCTGILVLVVSYVQYIISKTSEKKEKEIKHNIKNNNSSLFKYTKIGKMNNNVETPGIKEDDLHRLLESYHNQTLQQANIQFWFSIVTSVLGFAFIFVIIFWGEDKTWYEYILRILPGSIIEMISVLFISQARETRDRATNFFMELNYDRKIEKSIEIADSIERDEIRADVKAKIALHIIGIKEKMDKE